MQESGSGGCQVSHFSKEARYLELHSAKFNNKKGQMKQAGLSHKPSGFWNLLFRQVGNKVLLVKAFIKGTEGTSVVYD